MGVNVVIFGDSTLVDLREDTVKPENLFLGETAHGKDGNQVVGTFTIEDEINEQDILIEQIQAALQGKAAGSGGSSGSDPVIRALTVTENGTYEAPAGVDGYSPVVVEVPVPDVPDPVDQATPVITVSDSGLITAKATQGAGVVAAGTKSATKQLTTKGATTITPGASEQTVVSAGTFVTGDIKVTASVNEDLEAILDEQEELIATLQETLKRKTAGSGGEGENLLDAFMTNTLTIINSNVENVKQNAFRNSTALQTVNLPKCTNIEAFAISYCTGLTSLYTPLVTVAGNQAFYGCSALKRIDFPELASVPSNCFQAMSSLLFADFGKARSIGGNVFNACYKLKALILRYDGIVSLSNISSFTNCHWMTGTADSSHNPNAERGYVYVRRAHIDKYSKASNWSGVELMYRALEDYTVDGTATGALDESKI